MNFSTQSSQDNCGCGTSRCAYCKMKFVCARSPYCCVGSCPDVDLTPVLTAITDGIASINTHVTTFENTTLNNFSQVNTHTDAVVGALQQVVETGFTSINTKLDQIISLLPTAPVNPVNLMSAETGLVPATYNVLPDDGTVLVEKKNIFGKPTGKYKEVKASEV